MGIGTVVDLRGSRKRERDLVTKLEMEYVEKLGVSSRFELLFLLFNERNSPVFSRAVTFETAGLNHPIESYRCAF